jgi:methyl-accepting chemotaxis protein
MSISKKLKWSFYGLVGLLVVLSLVSGFALWMQHSSESKTTKLFQQQRDVADVGLLVMQNRHYLSSYLLTGYQDDAKSLSAGVDSLQHKLADAINDANSSDEEALRSSLRKLKEGEDGWLSNFATPLMEKRKKVDAGEAKFEEVQMAYFQADPIKWVNISKSPLKETQDNITGILTAKQHSNENWSLFASILLIAGTIFAVGAGTFIAIKIPQSITEPLAHLISVAREIGNSGDLNQTVDISRGDEIGELAQTFNNMVGYLKEMATVSEAIAGGDLTVDVQARSNRDTLAIAFSEMTRGLRKMVKDVRDGASQVASGSNQVASASEESARINVQAASAIDEVTSTMHEMSINVQNMVKNTQTQSSSVSETSASIDQMVASIQRVADTAKVLLDISQRSREEVQSGIGTMEKATNGLNRINQAIESSASIIGDLGQKTDDIGKIVEVIDDLAEQTNLLALNAAIEAARAGEHGLGFAVVADEVRKLAEKSAQSTREISELIGGIQKEARKAVENMGRSTSIVEEGLTLGGDLGGALKKISNVVTEVYKFAQEIGAATNEQSHGSTQIAKATSRLNEITHEINSAVEEQSSGAQAVVRAMEKMRELTQRSTSGATELAASSEQMSKMARTLLESMDRFLLESANGHSSRRLEEGRGYARLAAHSSN